MSCYHLSCASWLCSSCWYALLFSSYFCLFSLFVLLFSFFFFSFHDTSLGFRFFFCSNFASVVCRDRVIYRIYAFSSWTPPPFFFFFSFLFLLFSFFFNPTSSRCTFLRFLVWVVAWCVWHLFFWSCDICPPSSFLSCYYFHCLPRVLPSIVLFHNRVVCLYGFHFVRHFFNLFWQTSSSFSPLFKCVPHVFQPFTLLCSFFSCFLFSDISFSGISLFLNMSFIFSSFRLHLGRRPIHLPPWCLQPPQSVPSHPLCRSGFWLECSWLRLVQQLELPVSDLVERPTSFASFI